MNYSALSPRRLVGLLTGVVTALTSAACDVPSSMQEEPPQDIVTIKESGAHESSTLTIPRYKIYQDPTTPDRLWVGVGAHSGPDTYYSEDAGSTWQPVGTMGWEFHMSMEGNAGGYVHFVNRGTPAAEYHRLHLNEFQPEHEATFYDYGGHTTSGNIAVNGDEIVIFTRNQEDDRSPVQYHRSTDNGESWENGRVAGTGNGTGLRHRVGSVVVDGQIALAYWKRSGGPAGDTIQLYRWDGAGFSLLPDDFTTAVSSPWTRQYAVTQGSDGLVHLAIWDQVEGSRVIRHAFRTLDSEWSEPVTAAAWEADDVHPQLSAYGNQLVLLYLYHPDSTDPADGLVYYRLWTRDSGWSAEPTRLSGDSRHGARFPVGPQRVARGSTFVPVIWTEGATIRFSRIGVGD